MTFFTILTQAVSSFIAIFTFLVVLNIPKNRLISASIVGMITWIIYYILNKWTNPIFATFIASWIGSSIAQIVSIKLRTPTIVFAIAILSTLVPGYLSYHTVTLYVNGNYSEAVVATVRVIILAVVLSVGITGGRLITKLNQRKGHTHQ